MICLKRDQTERDNLIFRHIEARGRLEREKADTLENYRMVKTALLSERDSFSQILEDQERLKRHLKSEIETYLGR